MSKTQFTLMARGSSEDVIPSEKLRSQAKLVSMKGDYVHAPEYSREEACSAAKYVSDMYKKQKPVFSKQFEDTVRM